MAKKWSQKTEKASLVAEDEFLIIDSEDAAPATKNKRVKVKNAAPYKKYVALLTQTGINAPVATVLENTIGNIVWTRTGQGQYDGTLTGAFPTGKVIFLQSNVVNKGFFINVGTVNTVTVSTFNNGGSFQDGILDFSSIEIRVYSIIAIP